MAKYSPQTNYFAIAMKLSNIEKIIFLLTFIFSIFSSIFIKENNIVNVISIVSLVVLSTITFFASYYQNKGEYTRRCDFADNSFGTKYVLDSSKEYYTNPEIEYGYNKVLFNLFENTFFSISIAKEMKQKKMPKFIVGILILIGFCVYGFMNSSLALPILQLFLSKYFIVDIIILNNYINTLEMIKKDIISILTSKDESSIYREGKIVETLVLYECNISYSRILLDSKIFNKNNERLSKEWIEIKKKYKENSID